MFPRSVIERTPTTTNPFARGPHAPLNPLSSPVPASAQSPQQGDWIQKMLEDIAGQAPPPPAAPWEAQPSSPIPSPRAAPAAAMPGINDARPHLPLLQPPIESFGPPSTRLPGRVGPTDAGMDALMERLNQEAVDEFDAANPGRREYNAAQAANGGRPFRTSELHTLSPDAQARATTTIGGTGWGNTYGDFDRDQTPIGEILRGLDNGTRQPVTVMNRPGMESGGGNFATRTIYPTKGREPVFGGGTVVRKVGNRNYFVDQGPTRGVAGDPGAPGASGAGGIPEGGFVGDKERAVMEGIRDTPMSLDKKRAISQLDAINSTNTYQYDEYGVLKRDNLGRPLKNEGIDEAQQAYRDQKFAERQTRRSLPNYQAAELEGLRRKGMAAMPAGQDPFLAQALAQDPGLAAELMRIQSNERLAGLQYEGLGDARRSETELNRARLAQTMMGSDPDTIDYLRESQALNDAFTNGSMTYDQLQAAKDRLRARRNGAAPLGPSAPSAETLIPLAPGQRVEALRAGGVTDAVEADEALKQVNPNSSLRNPGGTFMGSIWDGLVQDFNSLMGYKNGAPSGFKDHRARYAIEVSEERDRRKAAGDSKWQPPTYNEWKAAKGLE